MLSDRYKNILFVLSGSLTDFGYHFFRYYGNYKA